MKFKKDKEILIRKALQRSCAMSDIDRRKELSKKGAQFLVDVFLGSNIPRDYDRPTQKSIEEFFDYIRESMRLTVTQKRRRMRQQCLNVLMRLFPTAVPILPGIVVQVPDIDDLDVISASEKLSLEYYLEGIGDKFEIEATVVPSQVLVEMRPFNRLTNSNQ